MLVHMVAAFISAQAADPVFSLPHFSNSAFSLLPHWSVTLASSPVTAPQVAIISGMIPMSQLRALLLTDKEKKQSVLGQGEQSLSSPISHFYSRSLSHWLSLEVVGAEVSPCDITALSLSHDDSRAFQTQCDNDTAVH